MKIRRTAEELQTITDAARRQTRKQDSARAAAEQALNPDAQGKVELSVSKTLLAMEEEGKSKVERLKELYQAGKLDYSGKEIAPSVIQGINEEVTYALFDNNDDD